MFSRTDRRKCGIGVADFHLNADLDTMFQEPDERLLSYASGYFRLRDIIRTRGRFSASDSAGALAPQYLEVKERVAVWLRLELANLRSLQKHRAAPSRRKLSLSRADISDVAMAMLEAGSCAGPELQSLLRELLDVDRHRLTLASRNADQMGRALDIDAQFALENRQVGVRELARVVGVEPSTVTRWRKSPEYKSRLRQAKIRWKLAKEE